VLVGWKSKTRPSQGSTLSTNLDSLVINFPFAHSSDSDVVKLFESSGFSLGKTENIRLKVIFQFMNLMNDGFITVMDTIKDKEDAIVLRECGDLLDISKDALLVSRRWIKNYKW
jgi:hypothetical protein